MCVEIEILGTVVDDVTDLRSLMPAGVIMHKETPMPYPEDGCLCWVDIAATAAKNGFAAREDGSMYYVFDKIGGAG